MFLKNPWLQLHRPFWMCSFFKHRHDPFIRLKDSLQRHSPSTISSFFWHWHWRVELFLVNPGLQVHWFPSNLSFIGQSEQFWLESQNLHRPFFNFILFLHLHKLSSGSLIIVEIHLQSPDSSNSSFCLHTQLFEMGSLMNPALQVQLFSFSISFLLQEQKPDFKSLKKPAAQWHEPWERKYDEMIQEKL